MTEQELIQKIQLLKQIKPKEEWVILLKQRIFSETIEAKKQSRFSEFINVIDLMISRPVFKPVLASLIVLGVFFGTYSFSQVALPGDFLYPVRKITEKGRTFLASEHEKSAVQLGFANNRLEDLTKIAEANQGRSLAPAIEEFRQNAAEAAQNIAKKDANTNPKSVKEIAKAVKKLEENKEKVEKLGVVLGETEELDNALAALVEREIKDLKSRTLSEKQTVALGEAEKDFENKDYSGALENILTISND